MLRATRWIPLAALTLVACTGAHERRGTPDGSPRRVGPDAGLGAGDTGRPGGGLDGAPADAPPSTLDATRSDVRETPPECATDDPGWILLPNLPAECPIARAARPECIPPIRWTPCDGGPPSCLRNTRRADPFITHGWVIDGEAWVQGITFPGFGRPPFWTLMPIDGAPIAAWREAYYPYEEPPGVMCDVSAFAVGGEMAAFAILHTARGDVERSGSSVFVARRAEIGRAETATTFWPLGPGTAWFAPWPIAVSDSAFIVGGYVSAIYLGRLDGIRSWVSPRVPGTPMGEPWLVGDHVLWETWADDNISRLANASFDITPAVFRDAAPDDLRGLTTDGVTIVWERLIGPGPPWERVELWAAPYVRELSMLAPRLVRVNENWESGRVGGRWYAYRVTNADPDQVHVVDLTDGTERIFEPPGSTYIVDNPVYVSEHEILVDTTVGHFRFDPHELPVTP